MRTAGPGQAPTARSGDPAIQGAPTRAAACDDSCVALVLLLAAAVIAGGVIVVAIGRGGELARFAPDVLPLDADSMTAADVALLRPPSALWGYDMRSTDEALNAVARTVADRDAEIASLRRQLADPQPAAAEAQDADPGPRALGARPAAPAGTGSRSVRERPGPAQFSPGDPRGDRPGDGG